MELLADASSWTILEKDEERNLKKKHKSYKKIIILGINDFILIASHSFLIIALFFAKRQWFCPFPYQGSFMTMAVQFIKGGYMFHRKQVNHSPVLTLSSI